MKKFGVLIVGIIFLSAGLFMLINNSRLQRVCTKEAEATVVDMKEEIDASDDDQGIRYLYYPVIQYTANGSIVEVTMSTGTATPAYRINDKITIKYNPKKTSEFIIKDDKMPNIINYVIIDLGIIVSIAGLIILFKKN